MCEFVMNSAVWHVMGHLMVKGASRVAYKRHCNTKVKTNASRQKVRRQLPIRQFALLR